MLEEKHHDLEMANLNLEQLKHLLEEKTAASLSEQELKTQSLAGTFHSEPMTFLFMKEMTFIFVAAIQEFQAQLAQSRKDRDQAIAQVGNRERELQVSPFLLLSITLIPEFFFDLGV